MTSPRRFDDEFVDLRVPATSTEPEPRPPARGSAGGSAGSGGGVTGRLSRRVLVAVAPVACVLVLAALVGALGSLWVSSSGSSSPSSSPEASADAVVRKIDAVQLAVVAIVASGVGDPIANEGDLGAAIATAAAAAESSPVHSAAADDATARYLDEVQRVVAASRDAVELGNSLSDLDAMHHAVVDEWDTAASDTDVEVPGSSAARRAALVVAVVVVLVAAAAALAWVARRRLKSGLDRPVHDLRGAVGGVVDPGPFVPAVQGYPELVDISIGLVEAHGGIERLRRQAAGGERDRRILEALALAEDERGIEQVAERALSQLRPDRPSELLMAEAGMQRLSEVATNPDRPAPGCPVPTVGQCTALRRGQVAVFDSSEEIDTCPYLRDRPDGSCSAVCVPVSVAARPAGVIHMTGPAGSPPPEPARVELVSLATSLGARYGALRTLENTRIEAATDGLTGLPNRRAFESAVADLIDRRAPFVMVLADLDKFKRLNDTYGHEIGDKALQLFSSVLRDNVRGNDLVARLGGEEFVLVYPSISTEVSLEAIGRLREALARELVTSPVPEFTCSFGIARSSDGVDCDSVLRVADAGLLRAKDLGGDQVVVADLDMAAEVFSDDA